MKNNEEDFFAMPTPDPDWLEQHRDFFDIELTDAGENKLEVIKAMRDIAGLALSEAKRFADNAPVIIREDVPKDEAHALKERLEALGAKISLK